MLLNPRDRHTSTAITPSLRYPDFTNILKGWLCGKAVGGGHLLLQHKSRIKPFDACASQCASDAIDRKHHIERAVLWEGHLENGIMRGVDLS
jgi:hypothetical protein